MAGQALYRKWRSQTFEEVVGQEHVALTLRNALREGRVSHAYLFTGPRGTGKTSTARILAKAVNCLADDPAERPCNRCHICTAVTEGRLLDLIEIDAASNRGIDEIRDLREKIGFRPNEARYKVYIIDEVHMLTKEAFNALLKTLEEPPAHAIFVLATTEPDRVPETVRSRCQRHDFRRVPIQKISEHLAHILAAEGAQAAPEALLAIARRSTGSMRDAISLLDQLLSYGDEMVSLARVESVLGLVDGQTIGRLVDCIGAHDVADGLVLINQLVANGVELSELVDQILVYLRALLFVQMVKTADALELAEDVAAAIVRQAEALTPATVLAALREYTEARSALRDQVPGVPQLPVEIAFVRAALPASVQTVATVAAPSAPRAQAQAAQAAAPAAAQPRPTEARPTEARPTETRPTEARPTEVRATEAGPGEVGPTQATVSAESAQHQDASLPTATHVPDAQLLTAAQQGWDRFLSAAGKRCGMKVQAALRSVREIDASGQTIILRFAHAFQRNLVDQMENRAQVEALWSELLGRGVSVRCVLVGENPVPIVQPAAWQPAARPASGQPESEDELFLREARNMGAKVKRVD